MFGWFKPTCPCDPVAKEWVESRLRWLSKQFGLHILLERPIILPTPEFFPDPWDGSPRAVRLMFARVCSYMGIDPESIKLELFDDPTPTSYYSLNPEAGFAAATWSPAERFGQRNKVRVERGGVYRPADLVGTMAHELSHELLLGEKRLDPESFDNELLTDLTAIYHGFGVFLANNPRKSTGELSRWPGTTLHRPEYLSEPMIGYALAHLAWFRDEDRPAWARHLRWTPRAVFKQGLNYLSQTANSTFKPVRFR